MFPQTVLDMLAEAGDRTCFEHGERRISGRETLDLIHRIAGGLQAAGLQAGDGIALLPGTSPEGFAALFAAYTLGLRVSGVRPGLTAAHFAHLVGEGSSAIVYDSSALPSSLKEAASDTPAYSIDELLHHGRSDLLEPAGDPDSIARISYTSGSTGTPKGVGTTYRGINADWPWNPGSWSPAIHELAEGLDRYLLFGTLASPVALDYLIVSLFHGGVVVIPESMPSPFFPLVIEQYRISGSIMNVPRLYLMLDYLRDRDAAGQPVDVSSMRMLMVSGSPINPRRLRAAIDRFGPVLFQGYGQTEIGLLTMLTPSDISRYGETALTSVGRRLDPVDIEMREQSEIFVRAPYQGEGYWQDPDQTAEVYAGGWVRTRDIGTVDADGFLHLQGRTRDVIIVGAMVYYAGPIESVLAKHPDVDQAYVTGAPDETTGEAIHAFIVPAHGGVPDPADLAALVRSELGEASVPASITVIPEVVAGPSGKPDKRATLARYL